MKRLVASAFTFALMVGILCVPALFYDIDFESTDMSSEDTTITSYRADFTVAEDGSWALAWTDARLVDAPDPIDGFQEISILDLRAETPRSTLLSVGYRPVEVAFDDAGNLYVSCYNPSRIFRIDREGRVELYVEDATSELICHPTNIAFDGATLYNANLGRWHIGSIASDTRAMPVVSRVMEARSLRR